MQASKEIQIVAGRETLIEQILFKQWSNAPTRLRHPMNILPIKRDHPSAGYNDTRQDSYQQALATPYRSHHCDDLTGLYVKLLDREHITARDALFQSSYLQHCSQFSLYRS